MKTEITNKITAPVLTALALILFGATNIKAAPGDLDLSFGSGGIVVTSIGDQFYYDEARTVLAQPDGKILVSGHIYDQEFYLASFFLARYHPTGALDASFGTNGKIITPPYSGAIVGNDIAFQPDGKIITVGPGFYAGSGFEVHRYNSNGTLDASFGGGGVVITPVGEHAGANSVAIQVDGKIVVAGYSVSPGQSYGDFAVVRLLPDGSLDTSFNGTGKVITSFGNASEARRVFLQLDGKIVAVGSAYVGNNQGLALVRYNSDGSLDSGFGSGGKIIHGVFNISRFWLGDAALQPDGKIIASGHVSTNSGGGSWDIIYRCNTDGSRDTSFASNGAFSVDNLYFGNGIALQTDGKLVAFGYENSGGNYRFAILRLNPNGTPDSGFGTNGRVITPIGAFATDGALQPDGKILAFGSTYQPDNNSTSDIAIVRYLGDAAVPRPAQFDFDGDRRADVSVFRPSDRVWYLNQSTNGFSATQFGLSTDKITPADYDGDGRTDIAIFRDGTWWRINSSNSRVVAVPFGQAGDLPVPADYTGDGRDELAVYRNGQWWALDLSNNQSSLVNFGLATDKPVAADYDGDGRVDQAVYRNGEWYLNRSTLGYAVAQFGLASDIPVTGDYDGDGRTDLAVYRDGVWWLSQSTAGITAFQFGIATDTPAPADYDGDGKTDATIYRNGQWWLRQSTSGVAVQQFGLAGDKPIQSAYLP